MDVLYITLALLAASALLLFVTWYWWRRTPTGPAQRRYTPDKSETSVMPENQGGPEVANGFLSREDRHLSEAPTRTEVGEARIASSPEGEHWNSPFDVSNAPQMETGSASPIPEADVSTRPGQGSHLLLPADQVPEPQRDLAGNASEQSEDNGASGTGVGLSTADAAISGPRQCQTDSTFSGSSGLVPPGSEDKCVQDKIDIETAPETRTEDIPAVPMIDRTGRASAAPAEPVVEERKQTAQANVSRTPRQYRPNPRIPAAPREALPDWEERASRDRALPIEVRLVFEKAGFCEISLLPRRAPDLPGEFAVSGSGDPPELIALQDEWYQDVVLPEAGALLRQGIEWEGALSDGRIVRWLLSGREIYVLCRHGDLNGFVSIPRLILGEQHVILCTAERLQDVRRAIELTGSPDPAVLDAPSGMPPGWVGLRGVIPRTPVAPSPLGDILDVLRPLAAVEIVLDGGIRLERLTWLSGYPPRIRLRGDVGEISHVVIDGQEATLSPDGGYVVAGWDFPGQHQVWCASASRSYSIQEGAEDWDAWDAYTWSMGDFSADGEQTRPAICGVLVRPPHVAQKGSRTVVVPVSNSVLLGAVPGQIQICSVRGDVRAGTCTGFPWFDPVWAIPADALRCDKRVNRILLMGDQRAVGALERPQPAGREHARRIEAWCSAISTAGRKGLRTEPPGADVAALWKEYKRCAKAIWKGLR